MVRDVRKNYPGLTVETLKSGKKRARVRFEGHPNRKIRLNIRMDQPKFSEHYWNARVGIALEYEPETTAVRQSIQWLTDKCLLHLERMVEADQAAAASSRQRLMTRLCQHKTDDGDEYGWGASRKRLVPKAGLEPARP